MNGNPWHDRQVRSLAFTLALFLCAIGLCTLGAQAAFAQDDGPKKHHELKYEITFNRTPPARSRCKASLELAYQQKDTLAVVDATLNNADCAASSGEYTVLIRYRDQNSEQQSIEVPVTWERDDDQTIVTRAEYVIGENVDLVNVRPRRVRCLCAATEDGEATTEE